MLALHKILLHVDATLESQRVLRSAIFLSTTTGATIVAVHIVNKHVVAQLARFSTRTLADVEVELEENGWRYLYAAEEEAKNAGARIVVMQEQGYPEEILPRLAAAYQAELVIVGVAPRSRSDATRVQVADQLIEHAPCAVLVVK
jgi:nucleotide-binding universal stress UspA family protein